jgi:hypothetical protein
MFKSLIVVTVIPSVVSAVISLIQQDWTEAMAWGCAALLVTRTLID